MTSPPGLPPWRAGFVAAVLFLVSCGGEGSGSASGDTASVASASVRDTLPAGLDESFEAERERADAFLADLPRVPRQELCDAFAAAIVAARADGLEEADRRLRAAESWRTAAEFGPEELRPDFLYLAAHPFDDSGDHRWRAETYLRARCNAAVRRAAGSVVPAGTAITVAPIGTQREVPVPPTR